QSFELKQRSFKFELEQSFELKQRSFKFEQQLIGRNHLCSSSIASGAASVAGQAEEERRCLREIALVGLGGVADERRNVFGIRLTLHFLLIRRFPRIPRF